ncbi:hypothetical protein ACU61A_01925 [Pseudonocardia sichuanensis]
MIDGSPAACQDDVHHRTFRQQKEASVNPPALDDKPPGLPFNGVDRMWSVSVAQILLWNFRAMSSDLEIDEF